MSVLSLDALVASSEGLAKALGGIERAAASDAAVLIVGEPGTGRSMLARLIHQESGRRDGPLVESDLAAIPIELFESELFGHRAGAFTGAGSDSPGRVGRAEGGTLLLDHVEEIPHGAQSALLRLVAEKRYSPLGGAEREADVRIVSIGSTDLRRRVERGAFREDLYYRLEVLTFLLPSLRRRRGDLESLTAATLQDLSERMGREVPTLSDRTWSWMSEYPWPGNLRQLRNVLEASLVLTDGDVLDVAAPADVEPRPRRLETVEKEEIRRALRHTRGHQGRAAELLGISRKTLWEKRRRYGLP